jgi:hypothetical protein
MKDIILSFATIAICCSFLSCDKQCKVVYVQGNQDNYGSTLVDRAEPRYQCGHNVPKR